MKKGSLLFYWLILVSSAFLYYVTFDTAYSHGQINVDAGETIGLQLIAILIVPLTVVLGVLRLWLWRRVDSRSRSMDLLYFVIPVLVAICCFATWVWCAIILSLIGGALIGLEFIKSIIKWY
jgi:hypothetical protein